MPRGLIRIVGLALLDGDRCLLVRKKGQEFFILGGGKREPGESDAAALKREIREELGCEADDLRMIGVFVDSAGGVDDMDVEVTLIAGSLIGDPKPMAEIEEVRWVHIRNPEVPLAPSLTNLILPYYIENPDLVGEPLDDAPENDGDEDGGTLADALQKLQASFKPMFDDRRAIDAEKSPPIMERLVAAGVTVDWVGGNCPVQSEGSVDGLPYYFRARGEHWSMQIGTQHEIDTGVGGWETLKPYGDSQYAAGWMYEHEALGFIEEAVAEFRAA
jgi:8-oxo-dGTP diphosphatase